MLYSVEKSINRITQGTPATNRTLALIGWGEGEELYVRLIVWSDGARLVRVATYEGAEVLPEEAGYERALEIAARTLGPEDVKRFEGFLADLRRGGGEYRNDRGGRDFANIYLRFIAEEER